MKKQNETKDTLSHKKNIFNKPWIKWLLLILILTTAFFGYQLYQTKKNQIQRLEFVQKQQEIMIEKWRESGLSEEEIQEKITSMQKMREERFNNPDQTPPGGFDMMRMGGEMRRMTN